MGTGEIDILGRNAESPRSRPSPDPGLGQRLASERQLAVLAEEEQQRDQASPGEQDLDQEIGSECLRQPPQKFHVSR
jgi:hypothetical protein